jgi:hypothetical protein
VTVNAIPTARDPQGPDRGQRDLRGRECPGGRPEMWQTWTPGTRIPFAGRRRSAPLSPRRRKKARPDLSTGRSSAFRSSTWFTGTARGRRFAIRTRHPARRGWSVLSSAPGPGAVPGRLRPRGRYARPTPSRPASGAPAPGKEFLADLLLRSLTGTRLFREPRAPQTRDSGPPGQTSAARRDSSNLYRGSWTLAGLRAARVTAVGNGRAGSPMDTNGLAQPSRTRSTQWARASPGANVSLQASRAARRPPVCREF